MYTLKMWQLSVLLLIISAEENAVSCFSELNNPTTDILKVVNELRDTVTSQNAKIEALEGQIKVVNELRNTVTEQNAKIEELEGQIKVVNELRETVTAQNAKIEELEGQIKVVNELGNTVTEQDAKTVELEGQMKVINELRGFIEAQNVKLQKLDGRIKEENKKSIELEKEMLEIRASANADNSVAYKTQAENKTHNNKKALETWEIEKIQKTKSGYSIVRSITRRSKKYDRDLQNVTRKIAFSSYLDHQLTDLNPGVTVKCNRVIVNHGNGYNIFTGIFTAPVSGTYFFTVTITCLQNKQNVKLLKDGQNLIDLVTHSSPPGVNDMATNSVVTDAEAGQAFWLETTYDHNGTLFSKNDFRLVTFTGFLLYES